jgi:hypothetical protein
MTYTPPPDAARVMIQGTIVGDANWSVSDEQCVDVFVAPSAIALVQEWTAALGGEFRQIGEFEE